MKLGLAQLEVAHKFWLGKQVLQTNGENSATWSLTNTPVQNVKL